MTRYADPSVCPDCRSALPSDPSTCPACDLPLRGPLAASLFRTLGTADDLLAQLRASAPAPDPVAVASAGASPDAPAGATHGRTRRSGLSGASVATVLLGLGALCLLVAAVTFLAVAWSWLGIGGRTGVLVGLTLAAVAAAGWLERRDLRVAAEALTLVALGLLALDAVGAENAGWLGRLSVSGTLALVGTVVLVGSLALVLRGGRLAVPQVGAALGMAVLLGGAGGLSEHDQVVLAVGVLAYGALGVLGRSRRAGLLPLLAAAGALLSWSLLVQLALIGAADHPSLRGLWVQGHGSGLLAAAALLLLPAAVLRSRPLVVRAGVGGAAFLTTLAVGLPGADEAPTTLAVVALALLLAWSLATTLVPARWRPATWPALALCAAPVVVVTAVLLAQAVTALTLVGAPFGSPAGVRLPASSPLADAIPAHPAVLVPGVVGLLLAAGAVTRPRGRMLWPLPVGGVALTGVATLALFPVPLWTVVASAAVVGLALVAAGVRRNDPAGTVLASAGGLVALGSVVAARPSAIVTTLALAALVVAARPSAVVTTLALAALVGAAVAVTALGRFPGARTNARTMLPAAVAALLWSAGEVASVDPAYRGVPIRLVLGALALPRPHAGTEYSALVAAAIAKDAAVAARGTAGSLALHLTVAGALVTTSALLHPSRRPVGWLGGLLLAAATWVRLAEIGVQTPEAYTLPSAVALLLVGMSRLHRDPDATTLTALTPGLVLALVPSLLWVLAGDVASVRALLLGLGCLLVVLAGVRLHWNAPLVVGSATGGLLVLRELAPYAGGTPQWVLIGLAGLLLTVVGVTWERRLLELRHGAAYLARLR